MLLVAMLRFQSCGIGGVVVGDEDPVVVRAGLQVELLAVVFRDPLYDVAAECGRGGLAVAELGDLALVLVDAGGPGPVADFPYGTEDPGIEGNAAEIRHPPGLEGLEEGLVVEPGVEAGPDRDPLGDPPEALVGEGGDALGGVGSAPSQLGVEADPGLRDEADEGMQGIALQVGGIRSLPARGAG